MVYGKVMLWMKVFSEDKWTYHFRLRTKWGDFSTTKEYLVEPDEKDLRKDMHDWAKTIKVKKPVEVEVEIEEED